MAEPWDLLAQLFSILGALLVWLYQWLLSWSLLIAWLAWWLWGVNWQKAWAVLAQGAWMPVLLVLVVSALVWSQLAPSACTCLGFVTVPNFWWQLGGVSLLAAVTLLCGWLQGVFGWTPTEVSLEPPAPPALEHGHGHHEPKGLLTADSVDSDAGPGREPTGRSAG